MDQYEFYFSAATDYSSCLLLIGKLWMLFTSLNQQSIGSWCVLLGQLVLPVGPHIYGDKHGKLQFCPE